MNPCWRVSNSDIRQDVVISHGTILFYDLGGVYTSKQNMYLYNIGYRNSHFETYHSFNVSKTNKEKSFMLGKLQKIFTSLQW